MNHKNYVQKEKLQNTLLSHQNFGRYFFVFFFSFFKDRFCCGIVKQRNFLHVVDLLFDSRFVKFYQFSLHYPINNIKVKSS